MLPTVHVPEPPELEPDPKLEPLPDPELEPEDPELEPLPGLELEPDEPELALLPELDEPELDCPPALDPPELDAPPSFPSDPPSLLSDEDEQEASTAMTAGRRRCKEALIANLHVRGYAAAQYAAIVGRVATE
jgi:hypothetical protein